MDRELHEAQKVIHRRIITPIFGGILIGLVLQTAALLGIGFIAQNTNSAVHGLRRQQSQLDGLVVTVDCNNRKALQDTVDLLVERGVLKPGQLSIISSRCK